MIDHLGIQVSDYAAARSFYLQALAPLGYQLIKELNKAQTGGFEGAGFGSSTHADFWISPGQSQATATRPLHIAFQASSREQVDAFYAAALQAGGKDNGAPGLRPHYHANYYGAFVLDLDGNNVEAVCHQKPLA